ncbi:MAG: hypothetical protein NZM12_01735 [Steroidobacteraceae bacterium]|nr:hypothetical protein [Steroidobacteraceae bacterium]
MLAWLWSVRGAAPGVAPEIDEALRLARQLAPETHLVTPSDALLAAYPFRPLTLADFSLSHGPSTESNL